MSGALHLTITTPMELLVDEPAARALRAEDESGAFGILPGHTDFLTTLPASVLRWRDAAGALRFCALRSGLLTVRDGARVAVTCREGILGDDLEALASEVAALRAEEADADRRARVEQMRLHSQAVRQLMRYLRPGQTGAFAHPPQLADSGDGGTP
ncbi:F0F1 ATP synthase subunit epsilon [Salipiger sp. P9]|uniref:F0F1 ATP synthase subunit epsilon n=1 Tax=Salipiger pentaromativorans TaxID=2943193 RepID=UPI00215861A2|nr:F0F1 ATP synthase subunit epsilon [Salipiger pentaromativorans]MCR8549925.1 F0F1 ATP synthase subunit epsilon [Salipiger pentaromativorans]